MRLATVTRQWFFADEWEFIVRRSRPQGLSHILDVYLKPHNEHWSTIPLLVYRAVFGVVGLKAYWPYLIVLFVSHLGLAWLISRQLLADRVGLWPTCAIVATFAFFGPGGENILWAFQFAWMGAVGAGYIAMLLLRDASRDAEGRLSFSNGRLVAIWAVLVGGLMCAGTGVSSVVAVTLAALIRFGWRRAALVASGPLAVQLVWLATYGRRNSSENKIDLGYTPYRLANYAWRAIASTVEHAIGFPGIGTLVLVSMIVFLGRQNRTFLHDHAEAMGFAGAAVGFALLVALGRVPFNDPEASRYAYVLFALLCPLIGVLVRNLLRSKSQFQRWAVVVLGAITFINSYGQLLDRARNEGYVEGKSRNDIRAAFAIGQSTFAAGASTPEPHSPDLTMNGVRRLLAQGIVIPGKNDPEIIASITARTSVDVTPQPRVPLDGAALQLTSLGRVNAVQAESGCVAITAAGPNPQFLLQPRRPTSFKLVFTRPGMLLINVQHQGFSPPPIQIPAVAGNPMFVNITDPRNDYVIGIPAEGITKLCGVGLDGAA